MSSLISDDDKELYRLALNDMHETFSRPVIAWKRSAERIDSTNEDYDEFYDKKKSSVTYTYQTGVFQARIKYIDRQEKEFAIVMAGAQVEVTNESQLVRLKFYAADCQFVQDSEKITVDGVDFRSITSPRFHGLFTNDYCTFYMKS
jgi:hypothetical protein